MRHCTQLAIEQRHQIYWIKKAGLNQSKIAADFNMQNRLFHDSLKEIKGKEAGRSWQAQGILKKRISICQ